MYWPNLGFSGFATESGQNLDRLTWNLAGTFTLSVPLLQGGAIDAQIHQAQGQVIQAQAQLETERQQVRLDVEQARLGIRSAKGAIAAAEDALANTRDRLRLAEGRYSTGVGSIIESATRRWRSPPPPHRGSPRSISSTRRAPSC